MKKTYNKPSFNAYSVISAALLDASNKSVSISEDAAHSDVAVDSKYGTLQWNDEE